MESVIDEHYRLILLEHYMVNVQEARDYDGNKKWRFTCPFCGYTGRTDAKKKHRKAVLLWNAPQNSWIFFCSKKGSTQCMNAKNFSNLIGALNPALGEAYRRDRWSSGTTGKGHNCRAPQSIVGLSTGTFGERRNRRDR
jgi:hypothetical protein